MTGAGSFSKKIQGTYAELRKRLIGSRLLAPADPGRANADPARANNVEFCVLVEAGALEAQALLLCSSIRTFAGAYSSAAIVAVSPRPSRRPVRTSLRGQ